MPNWAKISTGLLFYAYMYVCWDKPSENAGLWQLPNVSSAFKICSPFLKEQISIIGIGDSLEGK